MANEVKDNRKHIRFFEDQRQIALISTHENHFKNFEAVTFQFEPEQAALVLDYSYGGCSIVLVHLGNREEFLALGTKLLVKVGKLDPIPGEVKWHEILPHNLLKIGIEFFATKVY